jgi:hypothetical protein
MKHALSLMVIMAIFLVFAGIMPCVSAFTVSSVDVTPGGFQPAGTEMNVIAIMSFPAAGPTTFAKDSGLQLSTDLVDSYWVPILIVDGVETRLEIRGGGEMNLAGENLSYKPSQSVQLMVTLTGKMPSDRNSGDNFVKIQERDSAGNIVSTAQVAMPEVTLIPLPPSTAVTTKKTTTLKTFTPIPTGTTPVSAAGPVAVIGALLGVALLALRRE